MSADVVLERKMTPVIEGWHATGEARPLLVKGARRTGKTYLIDKVCQALVPTYVKLDFQTDLAAIEDIFSVPTDEVDSIVSRIAEYKGRSLDPANTILFFDEVQLYERALNSLRFFSGSRWRVIASGSLLGVAAKRRSLPFPSGVRQEELHPLDFEEFLWAVGERAMADAIREHFSTLEPYVLHQKALELYRRYLVVGGMPLPLRRWCETGRMEDVATEQAEIDETYVADMTDPDTGISGVSAKRIWESLPKQLLRASTKKFKYADVVRGGRRERLLEPLEWLDAAGVVSIHDLTKDTQAPLAPFNDEEGSFFKVYVSDTGLMFRKFGIDATLLTRSANAQALSSDFRGALAENYVMQALRANGVKSYYWVPDKSGSNGELDFVYQTRSAQVVPIEVKSARNVSSKTLQRFMEEGSSPYAYRLSERQFGRSLLANGAELRSIPLYAAFCIVET